MWFIIIILLCNDRDHRDPANHMPFSTRKLKTFQQKITIINRFCTFIIIIKTIRVDHRPSMK